MLGKVKSLFAQLCVAEKEVGKPGKLVPAISGLLLSCHFTLYTQRWQRACRAESGSGPLLKNTHSHEMFYFWREAKTCGTILKKWEGTTEVRFMSRNGPCQVLRVNQGKLILSPRLSLSSTVTGSGADHRWERLCPRIPPVHLQRGRRSWDGDDSHVPSAGWDADTQSKKEKRNLKKPPLFHYHYW